MPLPLIQKNKAPKGKKNSSKIRNKKTHLQNISVQFIAKKKNQIQNYKYY